VQYKSIIRLFEYCGIDGNKLDTGRIRKIISAEFALAESGIISIDGFDYSKNDALIEIDSLDFVRHYPYHEAVWNSRTLLDCLERNTVASPDFSPRSSISENPDFVRFISPYFAGSFDKIMRKYLRDFDFKSANKWTETMSLLDTPEDEAMALDGVRLYLTEFISRLKNSNSVTCVEMRTELNAWAENSASSDLINRLMTFFPDLVDNLARVLVNFTVTIQFTSRSLCFRISCRLVEIKNLDTELSTLILENHRIYRSKMFFGMDKSGRTRERHRDKRFFQRNNFGKYIGITSFLLYFVIRMCSGSLWNTDRTYETHEREKSLRELLQNINRDNSQSDFRYSGNSSSGDLKPATSSPPADSSTFSESVRKYDIDLEFFRDLRRRYSRVKRMTLDNTLPVPNMRRVQMCYLRFFHAASHVDSPIVLNVTNKTAESVMLYIDVGDSSLMSLKVRPGKTRKLQRTFNSFEILVKLDASSATVTDIDRLLLRSFLVSDERNIVEHTFDSFPGTGILKVDTDIPDRNTDFKLMFLPGKNANFIRLSFPAGYVGDQ
jgi:hypothetical protein